MELSNQKQTPITYEQVRTGVLKYLRNDLSRSDLIMFWPLVAPPTAGLCSGQAAGRRGVSGVLRIHLGEKHPQRVPHRGHGLHQQAAAAAEKQPHPPPLQKTPAPPQQVGFALLHLQEGEGQELLGHVSGDLSQATVILRPQAPAFLVSGKGGWAWFYQGVLLNPSLTPPETKHPSEEVDTSLSTCSWTFAHIRLFPPPFILLLNNRYRSRFRLSSYHFVHL